MKLGSAVNNLLQLAFIGACVYLAVTWGFGGGSDDPAVGRAESACLDAIEMRYGKRPGKAYAVDPNSSGFVVRASITVRDRTPAKVYCLANEHGGVEELRIVEQ